MQPRLVSKHRRRGLDAYPAVIDTVGLFGGDRSGINLDQRCGTLTICIALESSSRLSSQEVGQTHPSGPLHRTRRPKKRRRRTHRIRFKQGEDAQMRVNVIECDRLNDADDAD